MLRGGSYWSHGWTIFENRFLYFIQHVAFPIGIVFFVQFFQAFLLIVFIGDAEFFEQHAVGHAIRFGNIGYGHPITDQFNIGFAG